METYENGRTERIINARLACQGQNEQTMGVDNVHFGDVIQPRFQEDFAELV